MNCELNKHKFRQKCVLIRKAFLDRDTLQIEMPHLDNCRFSIAFLGMARYKNVTLSWQDINVNVDETGDKGTQLLKEGNTDNRDVMYDACFKCVCSWSVFVSSIRC